MTRIDILKTAFMILGFIALGFSLGIKFAEMKPQQMICPPPWNARI